MMVICPKWIRWEMRSSRDWPENRKRKTHMKMSEFSTSLLVYIMAHYSSFTSSRYSVPLTKDQVDRAHKYASIHGDLSDLDNLTDSDV